MNGSEAIPFLPTRFAGSAALIRFTMVIKKTVITVVQIQIQLKVVEVVIFFKWK